MSERYLTDAKTYLDNVAQRFEILARVVENVVTENFDGTFTRSVCRDIAASIAEAWPEAPASVAALVECGQEAQAHDVVLTYTATLAGIDHAIFLGVPSKEDLYAKIVELEGPYVPRPPSGRNTIGSEDVDMRWVWVKDLDDVARWRRLYDVLHTTEEKRAAAKKRKAT